MANTEPELIVGDINGDGKFTSADAVLWLYNDIFGRKEYKRAQSADFNGDGKQDADDAVYLLFSSLFGQDVYALPEKESLLTRPDERITLTYTDNGVNTVKSLLLTGEALDSRADITDKSGVKHSFVGWYNAAQSAQYSFAPEDDITLYAIYKGYTKYSFDSGVLNNKTTATAASNAVKFENGNRLTPSLLDGISDRTYALTSGNTYVLAMKCLLAAGKTGVLSVYGVKADGTAVQLDINEYTYDEVTVSGGKWSSSASSASSFKVNGTDNWTDVVFSITASLEYASFYIEYTGESELVIDDLTVSDNNINKNTVNGVDISNFRFVRPHYNSSYLTQIEMEKLCDKYGIKIVEDNSGSVTYEIIVGDTTTTKLGSITDSAKYSVKIEGTKVYINGGSPHATAAGVTEFGKLLERKNVTDADSFEGSYTQAITNYDKESYYTVKWSEDFSVASNGHETGVDLTKWSWVDDGDSYNNPDRRPTIRSHSKEHLTVADGTLNFKAGFDENYYYGFKITTKNRMTYKYGIVEMSAKLPHGSPFWIALWACAGSGPEGFGPEIDIVEMFGNSQVYAANMHAWHRNNDRYKYWLDQGVSVDSNNHWSLDSTHGSVKKFTMLGEELLGDEFHTFAYIWDETAYSFACDGEIFFTLDVNNKTDIEKYGRTKELYQESFNQPIYLILSEATAFSAQFPDPSKIPADNDPVWTSKGNNFRVDFVNIYQLDDGKSEINITKP